MIKITVELISARDHKTYHLGTAFIYNDGTGSTTRGNYVTKLGRSGKNIKVHESTNVWKTGTVLDFPRKQLLVWDLIYRALRNIVGDRNVK